MSVCTEKSLYVQWITGADEGAVRNKRVIHCKKKEKYLATEIMLKEKISEKVSRQMRRSIAAKGKYIKKV